MSQNPSTKPVFRQVKQKSLLAMLQARTGKGLSLDELKAIQKILQVDELIDQQRATEITSDRLIFRGRDIAAEEKTEREDLRSFVSTLHTDVMGAVDEGSKFEHSTADTFSASAQSLLMEKKLSPGDFKSVMGQSYAKMRKLKKGQRISLILLHFRG
jgi:hypothetical protein